MFGKKKEEPVVEQAPVVEEKKDVFVKSDKTVIGPGITMIGDFTGSDPLLINGTIRGTVSSDAGVHITKSGQLLGDGKADSFDVDGYINGNVDCRSSANFSRTGKMKGTLSTVRLKTDEGSNFEGTLTLKMVPNQPAPPAIEPEAAAKAVAEALAAGEAKAE